jgi:hypothetical protein
LVGLIFAGRFACAVTGTKRSLSPVLANEKMLNRHKRMLMYRAFFMAKRRTISGRKVIVTNVAMLVPGTVQSTILNFSYLRKNTAFSLRNRC